MKITREADYALRIMALMSSSDKSLDAKTIAEKSCVPYRFALKILRKIVSAGYIKSYRGVNGGYELALPADRITLKDIIEIIDGKIVINRCDGIEPCVNNKECRVREHIARIQSMVAQELDKVTFECLIK